jgi:histidine kinase
MKLLRRYLILKLFVSYLVVILVSLGVLAFSAELIIPGAFERHMGVMMMSPGHMEGMMGGSGTGNLFWSFRTAFNEILAWAAAAAFLTALVVSVFVSRRVVAPVKTMRGAASQIAAGNYAKRVPVSRSQEESDELGQLAYGFNHMAEQLEQIENKRRQLIGDISHELRTPLTAIKGYMEGLVDEALPGSPETYQEIYREADRLQRLVNDLEVLSRIEAQSEPLQLSPVPLEEILEQVLNRLAPQFEDKQIDVATRIQDHLPPARADADRVTQVLTNLLGNALQYTPAGGKLVVSMSAVKSSQLEAQIPGLGESGQQNWLLVSVQDSGIGLAPEHIAHVFERFYRVDKSRSRASGGSGIGLAISRSLVQAHGGSIWARSAGAGQGSTFSFTLPQADRNSLQNL